MSEPLKWDDGFHGTRLRIQFNRYDENGRDSVTGKSDGVNSNGYLTVVEPDGNRYYVERSFVERIYILDEVDLFPPPSER